MRHLLDFIVESSIRNIFEASAKFDHAVNSADDLFKLDIPFVHAINKLNIKNEVIELLNDILGSYNGINIENKLIYTTGKESIIKIPYAYRDTIKAVIKNHKTFTLKDVGLNKIFVLYNKKEILETGSGSLKTVNTRDQEVGTCLVWNYFIETLKGIDNFEIKKEDVNNIMKDIMESSISFNDEWAHSFTQQILCIKSYLSQINEDNESFLNYRCERYGGDKSFKSDESNPDSGWYISTLYEKFIAKYVAEITGKKDNYDPTDIIIYNINKKNEIIETLKALIDIKDILEAKKRFIQIFYGFNDHTEQENDNEFVKKYKEKIGENALIGLSLKKISSEKGSFQVFNIAKSTSPNKVTDIVKADNVEKNGKIIVKGHFIFADENNDGKIDETEESCNYCALTYRSFGTQKNGSENIGMDVIMTDANGKQKGPSLGKVPVRDWKNRIFEKIGETAPSNVVEGRKLLAKYVKEISEEKQKEDFTFLIQEAIKVGPNCFPFVIIH